jgi:2-dehydro-3-deoxyphosphogluconate aldolase/(4S)-4-hydroxy-2-oxoglutarate aldolase
MTPIEAILRRAPVMPVVTIRDAAKAVPLARALAAGGLTAIEITLRTPAALEAIAAVAREVPESLPGAGTVLTPADLAAATAAGAAFAVSPGATPVLLAAAKSGPLPFLPGVASASELMAAREAGFGAFKLFPAAQCGGPAFLKALAGPFASAVFCPTGGIDLAGAPAYLALANVACVGGSWVAPEALIEAGDFGEIERLAGEAAALSRGSAGSEARSAAPRPGA